MRWRWFTMVLMFVRAYLRASTSEQDATRARAQLDAFVAERDTKLMLPAELLEEFQFRDPIHSRLPGSTKATLGCEVEGGPKFGITSGPTFGSRASQFCLTRSPTCAPSSLGPRVLQ